MPVPDVVALLDHLRVPGNVGATAEGVAGADVLQVKQLAMLMALMTKSKVDTRAVLRGRPNEVGLDLWNV